MEAKVGWTDLTDTKLLLLKTGRRHGISVFFLSFFFLCTDFLHFHENLLWFIHISFSSQLLSFSKKLSYFFIQFMYFFCLRRNFCTDLLLRLCQPFLGKLRSPITLSNEGLQVIHRLAQERQRAPVSDLPATSELMCSIGSAVLGWFLRPVGSVGRSALLLTCPQSHSI